MTLAATDPDAPAPAREPRRGFLVALAWAVSAAVCTGGMWAVSLVVARSLTGVTFVPDSLSDGAEGLALLYAAGGAGCGLLIGATAGVLRGGSERSAAAVAIGTCGALFGLCVGGLSVLAVAFTGAWVHPLVSSSLAVAAVAYLAGLCGYIWSRWARASATFDEYEDDADADGPPGPNVGRPLREPKAKRWRLNPALGRVLPVLIVSAGASAGAVAFAPADVAFALSAVAALGMAVALVLYRQEKRLDALERLPRHLRDGPNHG